MMADKQEGVTSPIKDVLEAIVAAKGLEGVKVFSYKVAEDFSVLWKMLDDSGDNGTKHIVIVWDDFPETKSLVPVNLHSVLTPYDWAFVYSYCLYKQDKEKIPPKIFIVDINTTGNADLNRDEKLAGLLLKTPWITGYRLKENVGYGTFEQLIEDICKEGGCTQRFSDDALLQVKDRYREFIGKNKDHHAVANFIAPAVMKRGVAPEPELIGLQQAFFRILQMLYSIKSNNSEAGMFPVRYSEQTPAWMGKCPQFPRFVLVDDQEEHFKPVCEEALGINNLKCYTTLDAYKENQNNCDILFLDLRLTDQQDSTPDGKKALEPLTMSPIELAKDNLSKPIIIFSSTQQRYVTEKFKKYPNIITRFLKPYPGDYIETMDPKIIMDGFFEAVTSALEMYEVGIVWRAVQKIEKCNQLKWDNRAGNEIRLEEEENKPKKWLRQKWLPVMQRGDYAIGAAMPWMYLRAIMGETRVAILERQLIKPDGTFRDDDGRLLQIIQRGHNLFPLKKKLETNGDSGDKEAEISLKEQRKIAIAVGLAFVKLIEHWCTSSSKSDGKQ